jgi:hypothetical protein
VGIQRLPQVSPWGTRQLLQALSLDCSTLVDLNATNYSLRVLLCPARDEEDEVSSPQAFVKNAPRRPPYLRLDGKDCTFFAMLVDCLQQWAPATAAGRVLSCFKGFRGASKVGQGLELVSADRYSGRLQEYLEAALGEGKAEQVRSHKFCKFTSSSTNTD